MSQIEAAAVAVLDACAKYVQGLATGDRAALNKAFAVESAHWKGIEQRDGKERFRVETLAACVDRWSASPFDQVDARLLWIEFVEIVLAVVCIEVTLDGRTYTDVLTCFRLDGCWKIVNKAFVEHPQQLPEGD